MEDKSFKYIAFISYRHNDLDKFVAENLHRLIETYKMPQAVVDKYNITDNNFRRVFRDQDELPLAANLEDPIVEALKESQFLIVICSPRLKESRWCQKEIEDFIKFHGRSNILCVLIEGEPNDSFPEILKYREEKVITKTGKEKIKKVPCEPLAMDVRGNDKKEVYKNLKKELIRAIAPMYHLDYDDIKRRHEEREQKRKTNILKIITFASLIFAIYSFILFSNIYSANKKLKYDQSINLATEAHELLKKDNRNNAILKSYQSITKYNNISMPITSKGLYELTDSLKVYYPTDNYNDVSELNTLGIVDKIMTDINQSYLLSFDKSGELILWDLEKESKIKTVNDTIVGLGLTDDSFTFIGKDRYAYINNNKTKGHEIVVLDLKGKEITRINPKNFSYNLFASSKGKYLVSNNEKEIKLYETDKYKEIDSYKLSNMKIVGKIYFDQKEENIIFTIQEENSSNDKLTLVTYNIASKKVISKYNIKASEVIKIMFHNDDAIVLSLTSYNNAWNSILTSYQYKKGKTNFQHNYNKSYMHTFEMSFLKNGNGTILLTDEYHAYLLDYKTGKLIKNYSLDEAGVFIQSVSNSAYWLFMRDGNVLMIYDAEGNYSDPSITKALKLFNFNAPSYTAFIRTKRGFLALNNENKIIIYSQISNDDLKKTIYIDKKYSQISYDEEKKIKEEYHFTKLNLISNLFYSTDKKLLFVTYEDNDLEIYDTNKKELLKSVLIPNDITYLDMYYVSETDNNGHIIKGSDLIGVGNCGYILDEDLEIIAYVPDLVDYRDGKLIIKRSKQYYELKPYSEDEIINKGKEYLKSKNISVE